MKIRRAQPTDARGIARVHVDSWRTTYRGILDDEYLDSLDYESREERWKRNIDSHAIIYVAENGDGQIVGFAIGGKEATGQMDYDGELYAIYLLQEVQGQGIGKQLTSAVMKELKQQGISSMIVWVLADNPSRRFYEALGGHYVASKPITIGKQTLEEVSYGWKLIPNIST